MPVRKHRIIGYPQEAVWEHIDQISPASSIYDSSDLTSEKKTGRQTLVISNVPASVLRMLRNKGFQEGTDYVLLYEVERVYECRRDCQLVPLAAA